MRISKAVTMLDSVSNAIGIYRANPDVVLIPTNSLDGVRVWIRGNRNIILPQWSPRKDDLTATNWTILKKSNKANTDLSKARKYTREEWRNENSEKA